jgi:long-chain acyl-CoA synthetase
MTITSSDKAALRIGDRTVTYRELIQKTRLFSSKFETNQGRAILFSENREGWVYAFLAIWNSGMIPVPVDFLSVSSELSYIISDCQPELIICSSARRPVVDEALLSTSCKASVIEIDDLESRPSDDQPDTIHINPDPDATAVIIYTSGTTGKSKGVMLSYTNLEANIHAVCDDIKIFQSHDRVLMLLPLHHILPLLGTLLMPFWVGCTVAISPSMASEDIIRTLSDNKVTIIIGVPRLYAAIRKGIMDKINKSRVARMLFSLARGVNARGFSRFVFRTVHQKFGGSIKYMVCGGAALDTAVGKDFRTLGFEILEGYGLTEAAPMISFTHPGKTKIGSPGFLLSCVTAEIRDEEIVVKGPNVMQGYYGKPEETAEVIRDGWLYTGDLGYIDGKGYIHITGRRKEIMVLSNGKNVNPADVEELLEAMNPLIKEAGVFQDGDRIRAIIVPDMQIAEEKKIADLEKYIQKEILIRYNQSVAPYKAVMQFTISPEGLPRTRLGKIQRFMLPSLATETKKPAESREEITLKEYIILRDYLHQEKMTEIFPEAHLITDLGVDSLERVGLQVFIDNTFGMNLDMEKLTSFENILQLSQYIHEHKKRIEIEKVNWSLILKQKVNFKLPSGWLASNILVRTSVFFLKLYFRFKGKGMANIPEEACIIVPNHQSFMDGLLVASNLKVRQMRRTFFYAKEKHIRNAFLKFLANRNNVIVMDVNNNLKESIQKMAEVLKKEKNLIIFPEGTRTNDGKLGDFRKTFAILSRELNVPIVPVAIHGAYEAMPKGRILATPFRRIRVEFLEPVFPENKSYEVLTEEVRSRIQQSLERNSG